MKIFVIHSASYFLFIEKDGHSKINSKSNGLVWNY